MRVTVLFYFVVILVISESRFLLKEFASKKVRERRSDTCIAEGRRYQDGDTIVFHNITTPVDMAMCTRCRCFAGNIGACRSYLCDLGQQPALVRACEQWKVREEGECCPKCVCFHAGNPKQDGEFWAKRLNDGTCFQCTCKNSVVDCLVAVCQKCSYGMQPQEVPGKCCPVCAPGPTAFTVPISTTGYPNFPSYFSFPNFPFRDEK